MDDYAYYSLLSARSSHQLAVDLFMKLAGQELPPSPVVPDLATRVLRARLMLEEVLETIEALGLVPIAICPQMGNAKFGIGQGTRFDFAPGGIPNLVGIADGVADIKVTATGTLSACGLPDEAIQRTVDSANLGKFGPGSSRRSDGKWIKPPHWEGPEAKIDALIKLLSGPPPVQPSVEKSIRIDPLTTIPNPES